MMVFWLIMILYIILNALGLYLLKSGFNQLSDIDLSLSFIVACLKNSRVVFGFIIYVASFVTWLGLISKKEISFAIPIMIGLLYFSTSIVAFLFLKESINLYKIIGMSLIIVGIIFLVLQEKVSW